jgi:hypothetical protein
VHGGAFGHAEARRDDQVHPVDRERHGERAEQAVGDAADGGDVLGVGDEHGELVAAGAGGQVLARRQPQAARHGEQEAVADIGAVGVDERAEAVEVEGADADAGDAAREGAAEPVLGDGGAGEAGEPFAHGTRGRPEPVGVVLEDD